MTKTRNTYLFQAISLLMGLFVTAIAGYYIGTGGISFQTLLVGLFVILLILIVALGEKGLRLGFAVWVVMFGLGYRTIAITDYFRLHPLSILSIILTSLYILVEVARKKRPWLSSPLVVVVMAGILWGWIQGSINNIRWDAMLSEYSIFFTIIPISFLVFNLMSAPQYQKQIFVVFFATGVYISFMGSLEYLFPSVKNIFPGLVVTTDKLVTSDGFQRAAFSFWGATTAIFISALSLPFAIFLWSQHRKLYAKALILIGVAFQIFAIYIAGWRSLWGLLIIVAALLLISRRNWGLLILFIVSSAFIYTSLPTEAQSRTLSLISALEGNYQDSSAWDRSQRISVAADTLVKYPLGLGWASAGWVHNDFLQVGANLGVIGGTIFLGAYLVTLWKIWQRYKSLPDPLTLSILGSFLFLGGLYMTQNMIVLPQTAVPSWFVWAITFHHLETMPIIATHQFKS